MVDLEPLLEAPFEEASNRPFEVLLLLGLASLGVVAAVGRSPATTALVVCYLLAIPGYLAYRVHAWEGGDEAEESDGDEGSERDGSAGDDETASGADEDGD